MIGQSINSNNLNDPALVNLFLEGHETECFRFQASHWSILNYRVSECGVSI